MPLENAKTDTPISILLPRMMTPLERAAGRFMRAPDHGESDPAPSDPAPADPAPADPPDPAGDPSSLMSGVDPAAPQDPADPAPKGAADPDPKDPKDPEPAVPETYELAMPEGFEIDPALMDEATPVFKELKLDNEGANKLVPLVTKLTETITQKQNDAFQAMAADWAKESQAAPDIGGGKWAETENNVARAFAVAAAKLPPIPVLKDGKPLIENGKPVMMSGKDQVQGFRDLLGNSKLGNHPTMIRMFNLFGAQIGEDNNFVRPDAGAQVKLSREQILYPNDAPKTD